MVQTSATFAVGAAADLHLAGVAIQLNPLNATHLVADIPDTLPGGATSAELVLDGVVHPLGKVFVAGFTGGHRYETPVTYDAYHWPRDGGASVLGSTNGVPTVIDLESNAMHPLGLPASGMRGPGATPDPDVFLVWVEGALESWRLRPALQRVESLGAPFSSTAPRQAMLMNANTMFLAPGQHYHTVLRRDGPSDPFTTGPLMQAEETEGVYLSPRGDRATTRVDSDPAGVAVFDAVSGDIAYRTPLRATFGVDFSPDGSRLVLGGRHIDDRDIPRLVVLDAGSGAVLADTTFDYTIGAVAWDADRPYIYVVLEDLERGPILAVLARETLATVAMMRPPGVAEFPESCCYRAVVAPSRVSDSVHLFWFRWSWRFTLPPS